MQIGSAVVAALNWEFWLIGQLQALQYNYNTYKRAAREARAWE